VTQATREWILERDPWNIALAKRIAETFITGLEHLKETEAFTFRLIDYIPLPFEFFLHNPYCENIAKNIRDGIKRKKILRSESGEWISPNQAMLAPPELTSLFDDADLQVLKLSPPPKFVSKSYTRTNLLLKLGCRLLDLRDVRRIIERRVFDFSVKSNECIGRLFIYLNNLIDNDKDALLNLGFLKARTADGNKVCLSRQDHVVLTKPEITVPKYVQLTTLDPDFESTILQNPTSKWFLEARLGITNLPYSYIVQQILSAHHQIRTNPGYIEMLLEHAQYLSENGIQSDFEWNNPFYRHREKLQKGFRFLDHAGGHDLAENLFQDTAINIGGGQQYRLAQIFPRQTLNAHYNSMPELITFFRIPKFPPIATGEKLSNFYVDLARATSADNLLLHLLTEKEVWAGLSSSTKESVCKEIRTINVKCTSGSLQPLETCYLPTSELSPLLSAGVNVLDVLEPDDAKWKLLKNFGVTRQPDAKLYLSKLKQLKNHWSGSDVQKFRKELKTIYIALPQHFQTDEEKEPIRYASR
jgi:hypothetical protein